MFSTWDAQGHWYGAAGAQKQRDPLAEFLVVVDRLLYGAIAAFLASVAFLLVR